MTDSDSSPLEGTARPGGAPGALQVAPPAELPSVRARVIVVNPGAELYGADRVLVESVSALTARFQVTVVLPRHGPLADELARCDVRVVRCPMPVLRNAAMRPGGAVRLLADAVRGTLPALRLLRDHADGGVYVNTVTIPFWPLLARLAGRRSVCHVHEAEQSRPRLLRRVMALGPALSDRVVVNSRFTLDVLTDVAPRVGARSTVVYNAVRSPTEVVPPRTDLEGPLRLLFVGRLSPRKGPQVALAALAELRSRGVDARLALLGSVFEGYEWFEAELRDAVEARGLTDRVDFLGFQPDVWPHLASADVVLVPSVGEESFGNTAVEAVLAARPLVVSASSGLREAAAGYASAQTVPPGRPAEWADAIERVADDWSAFRQAAVLDAEQARHRHARGVYRDRLVEVMASLEDRGGAGRVEPLGGPPAISSLPLPRDAIEEVA